MSDGEIRTGVYTVTVKRESDGMPVCRVRRFEKPLSDEEAMALFGALWRTLAFDGKTDAKPCPACHGEGSMKGRGHHGAMRDCETCGGSGVEQVAAEAAGPEPDFPAPSVAEPTRFGPGPGDPGTSKPTHMGRG